MNFESVEIFIYATDERDSLIKTVDGIMSDCDINDIKRILIIHSRNSSESCLEAISILKDKYPQKVDSIEQLHSGLGGAISDSRAWVTSSHVILTCADLAIDLSSVPRLIAEEKLCPDGMVKSSRWLKPGLFHDYSPVKKFFNRIAQAFLRALFHSSVTDFTNPVQIMPSDLFKKIEWKEPKVAIMLELVLVPVKMGVKIKEIPTDYYGRTEGKSKNSFLQTVLYLKTALRVKFFEKV